MGFLDRLLGREEPASPYQDRPVPQAPTARSDDDVAIERYRYLLRTAPPETIEQVHAEAFARLTPEQRAQVFQELSRAVPPGEAPRADDPASLARAATRAELRAPGTTERAFSGATGPGFGGTFASSLLGTVVGYVVASALVSTFLPDPGSDAAATDSTDASGADASGADASSADGGADANADSGGWGDDGGGWSGDSGSGWGGDGGGWGGGGGDFGGGGDLGGGGDFGGF